MEKKSILIADSAEPFRITLEEALQRDFAVIACDDGVRALELLLERKPELLILDLTLPGLDGISVLRAALEAGVRPRILVLTRLNSEYIERTMEELGISFMMKKPCRLSSVVEHIRKMSEMSERPRRDWGRYDTFAEDCLISLGILKKRRSFECLMEALRIFREDTDQTMTKELYPTVGARCQGNMKQVERAIRSAIDTAWKKRDENIWGEIFKPNAGGEYDKPSNYVFLLSLHRYILKNSSRYLR